MLGAVCKHLYVVSLYANLFVVVDNDVRSVAPKSHLNSPLPDCPPANDETEEQVAAPPPPESQ